jgi:hypothetical protein
MDVISSIFSVQWMTDNSAPTCGNFFFKKANSFVHVEIDTWLRYLPSLGLWVWLRYLPSLGTCFFWVLFPMFCGVEKLL